MEQTFNTFEKGLQMDTNPLMLSNNSLTDALNATFVTMDGNELVLQNDMGNRRIDNAFLPSGYEPVGIKEHGGIIYIASYNPITNKSQIGSFPSPERKVNASINSVGALIDLDSILSLSNIIDVDYLNDLPCITHDSILYPLTNDTSLHAGDKFVVFTEGSLEESKISNFNNIYTNQITGEKKIRSPKNKKYTLSLGVLNSLNEFVDITKSLVRWDGEHDEPISYTNESELFKFNDGYFIKTNNNNYSFPETLSGNDKLLILDRQTIPVNTYAYKLVGPLYLKLELNHIQEFTYNIYGTKVENLDGDERGTIRADLTIEAFITYNCPDGITSPISVKDDNYYSYYDLKIPTFDVFDLKNSEKETISPISDTKLILPRGGVIDYIYEADLTILIPSNLLEEGIVYQTVGTAKYHSISPITIGDSLDLENSENVIITNPNIIITDIDSSTMEVEFNNGNIDFVTVSTITCDIIDLNPEGVGTVSGIKFKYNDILYNKLENTKYDLATNTYSCKVTKKYSNIPSDRNGKFEYVLGVLADKDISNVYLSDLSVKGELDFSLFGSGIIELNSWRFVNSMNDRSSTILYNLNAYPKYGHLFYNGLLTFHNILGTLEPVYEKDPDGTYLYINGGYTTLADLIANRYIKEGNTYSQNNDGDYLRIGSNTYVLISLLDTYKRTNVYNDIIIPVTLNNGKNIINIDWDTYGFEPRTMYTVTLTYEDYDEDTGKSYTFDSSIYPKRWFLTTELFNSCYNIGSSDFILDYGNIKSNEETIYINKCTINYKCNLDIITKSNDRDNTHLDGDVICKNLSGTNSDIKFTSQQHGTLKINKSVEFDSDLYPNYISATKDYTRININNNVSPVELWPYSTGTWTMSYTDGTPALASDYNPKLTYDITNINNTGIVPYSLKNFDWINWEKDDGLHAIQNGFVKLSEVKNNIMSETDNLCSMISLDWDRESSSRDEHYLKVDIARVGGQNSFVYGRTVSNGDEEHNDDHDQYKIGHLSADHRISFLVKDYMSQINLFFNEAGDYNNTKRLFTWGWYDSDRTYDPNVEIGPSYLMKRLFLTLGYNLKGYTVARVWWRTVDDTWALFDNLFNVSNRSNPGSFIESNINTNIIFAYYKEIEQASLYGISVAGSVNNRSEEYKSIPVISTWTINFTPENIIEINSVNNTTGIPNFILDSNYTSDSFTSELYISSSDEFTEKYDEIIGHIGTLKNVYIDGCKFVDKDGDGLNPNHIYIENTNRDLQSWSGNIAVDNDYKENYRGILYSKETTNTPKNRYDVGGSNADSWTVADYAGVNVVTNVK